MLKHSYLCLNDPKYLTKVDKQILKTNQNVCVFLLSVFFKDQINLTHTCVLLLVCVRVCVPACEVCHFPGDHGDEEGAGGAGGQHCHGVLPQAGVHQLHLVLPRGEDGGVHILRLYSVHLGSKGTTIRPTSGELL